MTNNLTQQQFWEETKDLWELIVNNINFKSCWNGVKSLEEINIMINNNEFNEEMMEDNDVGDETSEGWGFSNLWGIFMAEDFMMKDYAGNVGDVKIRCRRINDKENKLIKIIDGVEYDFNGDDLGNLLEMFITENKLVKIFIGNWNGEEVVSEGVVEFVDNYLAEYYSGVEIPADGIIRV